MATSFITNLDELEKEINDLINIEKGSKRKTAKPYKTILVESPKGSVKSGSSKKRCRCKFKLEKNGADEEKRTPSCSCVSKSSNMLSVRERSCPSSCQTISKSNYMLSSSSIHGNSVKSARIAKKLTKEILKAKSNLQHLCQCKSEAKSMTKSLKSSYNDLMENKQVLFQEMRDLVEQNDRLKKELNESRKIQSENKKQIEKLRKMVNEQTEKSAIVLLHNENKLTKRIKKKDERIHNLSELNLNLEHSIEEREHTFRELTEKYCDLEAKYHENLNNNRELQESNQGLAKFVKQWEGELNKAIKESTCCKDYITKLQKQIADMKHEVTNKDSINETRLLADKYKKQLDELIEREKVQKKKIEDLEEKVMKLESEKCTEVGRVNAENQKLQLKLMQYEECASKCKELEETCKRKCEIAKMNEDYFRKERKEMHQLIDELTSVIKQNKHTLLQLSKTNKIQEDLIKSQSDELVNRKKELDSATSEIEMFKKRSHELETEIESLKNASEESLKNKETCVYLMHEIDVLRSTLNDEKKKEKIIQEQSQTICGMECELQEKTQELNKAECEMLQAENEIDDIRNELATKREQLQKEIIEKNKLNAKLSKLEADKNDLTLEMENLQELLETYNTSAGLSLQDKLPTGSELNLAEKRKAINAATFATRQLLETVTDFQTEMDEQKRIQYILTDLLRNKDEQLNLVKSKITSLTAITHVALEDFMQDTYNLNSPTPSTITTQYDSCSSTAKPDSPPLNRELEEILKLLSD